ncbi:1-pyrroline-5-carboxylate dehydrogenase [Mycobacterium sp. MS1601]|uniref:L-glutamate gamma-semialdehyde dehydrogenase n=1 Tax=Mycobacterium sp. MS1601 TaxID=1936029 RepID=UPI00097948D3|nr:L-glutamate gamma-semialdehyde dehydrogenase [Mycobacterium sp. MS1601]AQA04558.1 1-pyrroline-5-carboxylate dehydrogenase [Mycobacterium sp. MS1601]
MSAPVHAVAGNFHAPIPQVEPVRAYRPGSVEAGGVTREITRLSGLTQQIPLSIGGETFMTDRTEPVVCPHHHTTVLGERSVARVHHVQSAIEAALTARRSWSTLPWWERTAVFLRAAELVTGKYRNEINAATMVNQSKTFHQAEIDAACEFADLLRFNSFWAEGIYSNQPKSVQGENNYLDQRGLEGFVLAVTPFNFTNIAANLPATAALMGNTVVWKPSEKSAVSSDVVRRIFDEAGLPPGVINTVHGDGELVTDVALAHPELAGLSFTGSTAVFRRLWKKVADHIDDYRGYPRMVGETGGKNAVVAHVSADPDAVIAGLIRGAFEFQGQKCSAASRAYIPRSLWATIRESLAEQTEALTMGDVADHRTFVGALIDEAAYDRVTAAIETAKNLASHTVIAGGRACKEVGYFVRPTIFESTDPTAFTLTTEFFGPVLTVYVYPDQEWTQMLHLVDSTSPYALTGSVYATDRAAIGEALSVLRDAAGYVAINDKPAGMTIGKQQFGGARASGTNDKIGSPLSLQRWVSGRFVKENLLPDTDFRYPYMPD